MRFVIVLAAAAAAWPLAAAETAPAAAPGGSPASKAFVNADKVIADATNSLDELLRCSIGLGALKKDYRDKLAELRTEFHGNPPPAFDDLLQMKQKRLTRHSNICVGLIKGTSAKIDAAGASLMAIEPKSLPGIKDRRQKVEALRTKMNAAMRRTATRRPPSQQGPGAPAAE